MRKRTIWVMLTALAMAVLITGLTAIASETAGTPISIPLEEGPVDLEIELFTSSMDSWDFVAYSYRDFIPPGGLFQIRLGVTGDPVSYDTILQIADALSLVENGGGYEAAFDRAMTGYGEEAPVPVDVFDLFFLIGEDTAHGTDGMELVCNGETYPLQGLPKDGEIIRYEAKDTAVMDMEDLYDRAMDGELPVLEGESEFGEMLAIHVIKSDAYANSILAKVEGESFYNVPDAILAESLDAADTAVIIYGEGETLGQYGGTDIDAVRTYTKVLVIDLSKEAMYEPYTACTADPPASVPSDIQSSKVEGGVKPEPALEQILEKMGVAPVKEDGS